MNIFMANDDGYSSPMMLNLAKELAKKHDVTVVAPQGPQSAAGHALTMHKPLRINYYADLSEQTGAEIYSCSGKPADCVKLGLDVVMKKMPHLMISGINYGANIGTDVMYSGTVAAALESSFMGIKSIATSVAYGETIEEQTAVDVICDFVNNYPLETIKEHTILNINVPNVKYEDIKGIKQTPLDVVKYTDIVKEGKDQFNRDFYWIGGQISKEINDDTDAYWIRKGYITVTPLTYIIHDKESMQSVSDNLQEYFGGMYE